MECVLMGASILYHSILTSTKKYHLLTSTKRSMMKKSGDCEASTCIDDSSTTTDEELDVLPPSLLTVRSNVDEKRKGPRLSCTASRKDDALELDDDENTTNEVVENLTSGQNHTKFGVCESSHEESVCKSWDASSSASSDESDNVRSSKPIEKDERDRAQLSCFATDSSSDDSLLALRPSLGLRSTLNRRRSSKKSTVSKKRGLAVAKKGTAPKNSRKGSVVQLHQKELKQKQKQQAKEERDQQRQEKHDLYAAKRQSKQQRQQECAQASGKFAKDEIAILLESALFHGSMDGDTHSASGNHSMITCNEEKDDTSIASSLRSDLLECGYTVRECWSSLGCRSVQWVRQKALKGGAARAIKAVHESMSSQGGGTADGTSGYELVLTTAIVVSGAEFIPLVASRQEESDDYPALEEWIKSIVEQWKVVWKNAGRPRIILFLDHVKQELDQMWVAHTRARKRKGRRGANSEKESLPTEKELCDAIFWILIEFQVECVHCSMGSDLNRHICKMTRMISEAPYQEQVTELECIAKLKSECDPLEADPFERAKDCWLRQLQQVPRVSRQMAFSVTCYYPTAASLWLAYQETSLTEDDKRLLCAQCFTENSTQSKLSSQLYTLLTSTNPSENLR